LLSVLIPAYNEETTIATTVRAVMALSIVRQVVVVDDGSVDQTATCAEQAGAEVVRISRNNGKGSAMNRGVALLTEPVVALLDGDLGESATELTKLAAPVLSHKADLTIATFPKVEHSGGFGLVKGLARRGISAMAGIETQAPLSGQRVLSREVLEAVLPFASGYGVEVAMTIRAARAGFRILEVETKMTHSVTGRDLAGFRHRGRQFYQVLSTLAKVWRSG
jgi:glycosyltransferase involved in cell wall biosynthesis